MLTVAMGRTPVKNANGYVTVTTTGQPAALQLLGHVAVAEILLAFVIPSERLCTYDCTLAEVALQWSKTVHPEPRTIAQRAPARAS